jgi:hypothetical protein
MPLSKEAKRAQVILAQTIAREWPPGTILRLKTDGSRWMIGNRRYYRTYWMLRITEPSRKAVYNVREISELWEPWEEKVKVFVINGDR